MPAQPTTAARPVLARAVIATPLGDMLALASGEGLCVLDFADRRGMDARLALLASACDIADAEHPHLGAARLALEAYFAADRAACGLLAGLELDPLPAPSAFRARCWAYLRAIPPGQTRDYRQQAEALGDVNACRAVAGANAANFLSIVIPCHRVIGAGGSMTGYGGGTARKAWLIDHERGSEPGLFAVPPTPAAQAPVTARLCVSTSRMVS